MIRHRETGGAPHAKFPAPSCLLDSSELRSASATFVTLTDPNGSDAGKLT